MNSHKFYFEISCSHQINLNGFESNAKNRSFFTHDLKLDCDFESFIGNIFWGFIWKDFYLSNGEMK